MNVCKSACLIAAALPLFGSAPALEAQSEQFFEVSFWSPRQLRAEDDVIRILRVSLPYGRNVAVHGVDVGFVARSTGGESKGLQYAVVGINDGDFVGWQNSVISLTQGHFTGFQSGLYNEIGRGEGFQLGLVNSARTMDGLQIGLVNLADNMYGIQIGLVNVIRSKDSRVFLPLINWSF